MTVDAQPDAHTVDASPPPSVPDRKRWKPWAKVILLLLIVGGTGAWYFHHRPCSPDSLAEAVECLKLDKTLPKEAVALPLPESGSLLGFTVRHGALEHGGRCYDGVRTRVDKSLSSLEINYKNAKSLKTDLDALHVGGTFSPADVNDVKLVLSDLSISRTTGVFDPLSACRSGIHDVIVWELRAGEASLVGQAKALRDFSVAGDAGIVGASSKLHFADNNSFKVVGKNIVIAYLTEKLSSREDKRHKTWTGRVRANDTIPLPTIRGVSTDLSLKVVSFDRRFKRPLKLGLSGGEGLSSTCAKGAGSSLELAMGIGDTCRVNVGDATRLVIKASMEDAALTVSTTLAHTTLAHTTRAGTPGK